VNEAEDLGSAEIRIIRREDRGAKGIRLVAVRKGELVYIEETQRAGVRRVRRPGIMGRWLDNQIITKAEFEAASIFTRDFILAHQQPRYAASSMERVDGTPQDGIEEARCDAQKRMASVYGVLGLRGGDIAKKVLGEDWLLSVYAKANRITIDVAKGMLLNVLDSLAKHYRLI